MPFNFLKYLQSTHYFVLKNKGGKFVYPIVQKLPKNIISQLKIDNEFNSSFAQEYDLSWQAIQKGYVGEVDTYTQFENLPLVDEYYFIRKYFNPIWTYYIFFLRILALNNPIKEYFAWKKSKNGKKSDYLKKPISYSKWDNFQSDLTKLQPKVSVIIPTLNRYKYLKDVLEDLEKQDYSNFEVIVVDQSEPFQKEFYTIFSLELNVIHQEEKALWLARNIAIKESQGELLLLFDDDSRVDKDWVSNHLKCIDFFNADISSGVSLSEIGAKIPVNYSFFRISDQIDTGNVLIKKEVFKAIGLFDRQFEKQRMGDGEFGLRSHLHGFLNISNPYADRLHLKVGTGGLRQMGSWDGFRPKKIFDPRPVPSVVYFYRKYYGNEKTFLALLRGVPPSIIPYRFKKNKKMMVLGFIISIIIIPIILFQVFLSWREATLKIKDGALIESINK